MTIIYDMANGSIRSESAPESHGDGPDMTGIASPATELQLVQAVGADTPAESDCPQTAVHIIRALLSSD
jgi:hypothetical protein